MNLVDSSGWLEYFMGKPNGEFFLPALEDFDNLVVPVISIFEVFKFALRERGEKDAAVVTSAMRKGILVDLTPQLAIEAARISLHESLPMADSIILATAKQYNATIWTQDVHFKKFPNVKYAAVSKGL